MLPQLHQHVLSELDRSVRADTVFVFGAVVLDIVSIAANSALAASNTKSSTTIFWLFMTGVLTVTIIAAAALRNGTRGCIIYHEALLSMYEAEGVLEHFPKEGVRSGITRYRLYLGLIGVLGFIAIAVPLIVKFSG